MWPHSHLHNHHQARLDAMSSQRARLVSCARKSVQNPSLLILLGLLDSIFRSIHDVPPCLTQRLPKTMALQADE